MRPFLLFAVAATLSILGTRVATAATIILYDEAISGDLSNIAGTLDDPGSPTQLGVLPPGVGGAFQDYRLIGRTDIGAGDFFTIEIGAGNQLHSILLTDITYDNPATTDAGFFLAIADGNTFPNSYAEINENPAGFPVIGSTDTTGWIGGSVIGRLQEGIDILPLITTGLGFGFPPGRAPPLGPGQYTFLLQQTGARNNYTLDFGVASATAIPEPSALVCLAVGAAAILARRRATVVS